VVFQPQELEDLAVPRRPESVGLELRVGGSVVGCLVPRGRAAVVVVGRRRECGWEGVWIGVGVGMGRGVEVHVAGVVGVAGVRMSVRMGVMWVLRAGVLSL